MKRKLLSTVFVISLLLLSFSGLMAQNKYYCVPLDAFHGLDDGEDYSQSFWVFTGVWTEMAFPWLCKPDSAGYVVAGINLPQDAVMSGFNVMYYDNGGDYITVQILRKNVWTSAYPEVIFSYQTSGSASFLRSAGMWANLLGGDGRQVKNQMFTYSVRIYFSSSDGNQYGNEYGIFGIRIVYH